MPPDVVDDQEVASGHAEAYFVVARRADDESLGGKLGPCEAVVPDAAATACTYVGTAPSASLVCQCRTRCLPVVYEESWALCNRPGSFPACCCRSQRALDQRFSRTNYQTARVTQTEKQISKMCARSLTAKRQGHRRCSRAPSAVPCSTRVDKSSLPQRIRRAQATADRAICQLKASRAPRPADRA